LQSHIKAQKMQRIDPLDLVDYVELLTLSPPPAVFSLRILIQNFLPYNIRLPS
jgi:hypothetical protein